MLGTAAFAVEAPRGIIKVERRTRELIQAKKREAPLIFTLSLLMAPETTMRWL